jgi:16S rRNA U1498 N3-methylase RsmE
MQSSNNALPPITMLEQTRELLREIEETTALKRLEEQSRELRLRLDRTIETLR